MSLRMGHNNPKPRDVDVDEFLEMIGQFGRMQIVQVAIFCLLIIPSTYQTLIMSFVGKSPDWECSHPIANNSKCDKQGAIDSSNPFYEERCNMSRDQWKYTKPDTFSIVTEWDLICEKKELSYLANSAMFIGWAFGAVLLGWVSDRFGRKMTLFPSLGFCVTAAFTMSFMEEFWAFFVFRIVVGVCMGGIGLTLFVMASELVGPKYRSVSGIVVFISFTFALCIMAVQAWLVQRWRMLMVITSIPYIVLLVNFWFVPESVRWLRVANRLDEAENILRLVARRNQKPWPNAKLSIPTKPSSNHKVSALDLFRPKHMAISTLIQCFAWFVVAQVYYGISLASDNLGGDMYRDFILTSIVEIPANLAVMYLTNRFGRRITIAGSMALSGVSCISVAFIPSTGDVVKWVRVAMGMCGKLFVTFAFSGIYVWSVELYPTVIRSQGMAVLSVVSRLGAASAPWIAQYLGYVNKYLPFGVMGALCLLSAFFCMKLQETAGMPTAETLQDVAKEEKIEMPGSIIENEYATDIKTEYSAC